MITQEIFAFLIKYSLWQEKNIPVSEDNISIAMNVAEKKCLITFYFPCQSLHVELKQALLQAYSGINFLFETVIRIQHLATGLLPQPSIKNIIAVASGKGGVGKSTIAINLALALQAEGATVGILDADIYGPSLPTLLGIIEPPHSTDGKTLQPIMRYGLQTMSIGFLLQEKDTAMIWRGPMASTALQQLFRDCQWDHLDYLLIDLPPGTGDIQLTLAQKIPVTAALIVTTPQDLAVVDAKKAVRMFGKVKVPVLGIIENMSGHVCTHCGHQENIFGSGGGAQIAENYQLNLLGTVPLNRSIQEDCDQGMPTMAGIGKELVGLYFKDIALRVSASLASSPVYKPSKIPRVVVNPT